MFLDGSAVIVHGQDHRRHNGFYPISAAGAVPPFQQVQLVRTSPLPMGMGGFPLPSSQQRHRSHSPFDGERYNDEFEPPTPPGSPNGRKRSRSDSGSRRRTSRPALTNDGPQGDEGPVAPGTVAKCYGQGHWSYGRVATSEFGKAPRGGNNNDILPADYDRLSGSTLSTA